jgi:hypothetical protein
LDSQASALRWVPPVRALEAASLRLLARVAQRAAWQALSEPLARLAVSAPRVLAACSARAACLHQVPRELCS